jgi:hypothetical protein
MRLSQPGVKAMVPTRPGRRQIRSQRHRIVAADSGYPVVFESDPARPVCACGKDLDDPAPDHDLARLFDAVVLHVSRSLREGAERAQADGLARCEREVPERGWRRNPLHEAQRSGDNQPHQAPTYAVEDSHAAPHQVW